jgi:hypothetical protein
MLAVAQESEDFAAGRIGDRPEHRLALLWFQSSQCVTIRLPIGNRSVTQGQVRDESKSAAHLRCALGGQRPDAIQVSLRVSQLTRVSIIESDLLESE